MVTGFLIWVAVGLTGAEFLGWFHALTALGVTVLWGLGIALLLLLFRFQRSWRLPRWSAPRDPAQWTAFGILVVLVALVMIRALASAPNAPDVLNYHLPRQLMWAQQGSLQHFFTPNDRLLMMPPLAEVLQLHLMLLSGGSDAGAALPQAIAYSVGVVLASLLVRELRGRVSAQWTGALLFATIPMAYHQASSSNNDLLLAVLVLAVSYYALRLRRCSRSALE